MPRAHCEICNRPQRVCLCKFVKPIENSIEIGIWQHPTEVKQVKGTAQLSHLCLQNSQLWVGETLNESEGLGEWLAEDKQTYVLYPISAEEEGQQPEVEVADLALQANRSFKVLVLDGTWRKTYKMMQLNPAVRALPRIALNPAKTSRYQIRKQKNEASLSTLEAIVELLGQLENDIEKYQPLLRAFENFQQQQLTFIKRSM